MKLDCVGNNWVNSTRLLGPLLLLHNNQRQTTKSGGTDVVTWVVSGEKERRKNTEARGICAASGAGLVHLDYQQI